MPLEAHASDEIVRHALLGVDGDVPRLQGSLKSLDFQLLPNVDGILCLRRMEYILLRNELSYCMQTLQSVENLPNHPVGN